MRAFFVARGVLEVETPALSAAANPDPNLESLTARYDGPGAPPDGLLWLQTSPEFAMKRLLAAGSGDIYQICRAYRAGERGRRHNPEFTLVEWYRLGFDHHRLMAEVRELVTAILGARPVEYLSYREAFRARLGLDPLTASPDAMAACAREQGIVSPLGADDGRDAWLDLLLSHRVCPELGRGRYTFLCDFPASQAALAKVRAEEGVAERFELFIDGLEIANGFHELADPDEQRARFAAETARRRAAGQPLPRLDQRLLDALAAGLPPCSGVALGFDRLVMLAVGAHAIDEVMAFPVERA